MIFDVIWKSVFVAGVSATICLSMMILIALLMKRQSARLGKWYFNSQIVLLLVLICGAFASRVMDAQLLRGCFETFVKESSSWLVTRWMAGTWLAGAAGLLSLDLVKARIVARRVRALPPADDPRVIALFSSLKSEMGIRRAIPLLQAGEGFGPFAYGICKPRVVLPAGGFDAAVLRPALAHELIHLRDRDALWMVLELFCRRLMFFHPFSYVFAGIYSATVEKAADEGAVARLSLRREDFVRAMLVWASRAAQGPATPLCLNASRGYREMRGRVEALMTVGKPGWFAKAAVISAVVGSPALVSIAQARSAPPLESSDPKMCLQVNHEKLIESWLRIEPAPPLKCGK